MPEDPHGTGFERGFGDNAVLDACARELLHGRGSFLLRDGKKAMS